MPKMTRRSAIATLAGAAGSLALPAVGRAQSLQKIRVGYLHTLAVDAQIWVGQASGSWRKQGLDLELTRFQTGISLFQALVGGSLDVLSTGAVISNFPARGQGKVFLANDIEFATAQLWVRPNTGINTIADLRGKRIATTSGTTANVFLYEALKRNGLDISKDVEVVNQPMPDAVTGFIAGAVPAVALWVPFDIQVRNNVPGAKMLTDASKYYPEAAIVDGWATSQDFYDNHKDTLRKIIRGWLDANDQLVNGTTKALATVGQQYEGIPDAQMMSMYRAEKAFDTKTWARYYRDGTLTRWLDQVTEVYVKLGAMDNPVRAQQYFDPSLFLDVAR
ncbi:MAG TPA: ABC transporter substrate-binding protein [Candidatus Elarobacter sp.]|jgi:NitT/TauT family transport system substrate-binding protein|nr:ABC transporter substrate-binding protein [Candidatus Elarobacter sp.]